MIRFLSYLHRLWPGKTQSLARLTHVAVNHLQFNKDGGSAPAECRQLSGQLTSEDVKGGAPSCMRSNLGPGDAHNLGSKHLAAERFGAEVVVDRVIAMISNVFPEDRTKERPA